MKDYLRCTRSPWYSFVFVLPLLVLYQVTALVANLGERRAVINGADSVVQNLLNGMGLHGWLGSWLVVTAVIGIVIFRTDPLARKGRFQGSYFPLLLLESTVYALLFGTVVATLTALVIPGSGFLQMGDRGVNFGQKLATSLGAGLYEELVFRLLMTGGMIWTFQRLGVNRSGATVGAVLLSSVIFSLFHYLGPLGEQFRIGSFAFRAVAGVVLAVLYATRGFATAAWTHALYDVFLLLVGRA